MYCWRVTCVTCCMYAVYTVFGITAPTVAAIDRVCLTLWLPIYANCTRACKTMSSSLSLNNVRSPD